ncbi:hypothetical protein [Longimicrobium terrae]|uniref:DUF4367 domain-containing protein n=1 Tax=Longimicrobium terrae TaxID=1639882 RepID=A0A841H2Y8_9BACT|nr:hypothetical protein [Longimicrobium terrae]MBB4637823.1 hypothetical protein [Longimicrobium terrae]MBB6072322.1 hypothetical protein [Longimicrobium terrae]NNC31241.1 hypothetical protein [Longimicrobium terrae]
MTGSNPRNILAIALFLLAGCGGAGPETRAADAAAPSSSSAPSSVEAPASPAAGATETVAAQAGKGGDENPIFIPILPRLRSEVRIPLRLPAVLGWEDEAPDSAFAIVERADSAGYVLMIALASDCDGGNWCRYGSVSGGPVDGDDGVEGTPVALADGVTGHFVDATCGAVCSDSRLWWMENGVRYAVGVKAADAQTLAAVARSAMGQR